MIPKEEYPTLGVKMHILIGPVMKNKLEEEKKRTGLTKAAIVKVALDRYFESRPTTESKEDSD